MDANFVLEDVTVLEFDIRKYNRKSDGAEVEFRQATIRYSGKLFKLSCSKDLDLKDKLDKNLNLIISMTTFGESLQPSLRIVGSAKKG